MKQPLADDANIYTVTMAEVYSSQGHYDKAVQIYRHLLVDKPHSEKLANALADTEKKLLAQKQTQKKDIVALFDKWIRLMKTNNHIGAMAKLKNSFHHDEKTRLEELHKDGGSKPNTGIHHD